MALSHSKQTAIALTFGLALLASAAPALARGGTSQRRGPDAFRIAHNGTGAGIAARLGLRLVIGSRKHEHFREWGRPQHRTSASHVADPIEWTVRQSAANAGAAADRAALVAAAGAIFYRRFDIGEYAGSIAWLDWLPEHARRRR